jgi:mono/diheme cytochrome c family protein
MRLFATLSVLLLLGLAVYFAAPVRSRRQEAVAVPRPVLAPIQTNAREGFYIGSGERRTYVQYATPDPVLRSFMQSVMDGSADPVTKGEQIFQKICAACHQKDGEGKDGIAPPLVGSEWVLAPKGDRLARIVLNGLNGPVQVRRRTWNLLMPPLKENLGDDEIAVVLSYVRSHLAGNRAATILPGIVGAARKQARAVPESAEDLLRVSAE